MNNRIGSGLNLTKKIMLTSAAAAAVAIPVLIGAAIAQRAVLRIARAQPPQAQTSPPTPQNSATAVVWAPQRTQTAPAPQPQGRRIAMLFDRGALTAEEHTLAQEGAVRYVREHLVPSDAVTIMQSNGSRVTVVQDFTNNQALLESAILSITPANGSVTPDTAAALEESARMLGVMHGKKLLMYFAGGARFTLDEAARARAVQAGVQNEVAFYPIDTRGVVPARRNAAGTEARDLSPGDFWQVMAVDEASAETVSRTLEDKGFPTALVPGPNNLIRVLVGPYHDSALFNRAGAELDRVGMHPVRFKRD